MLELLLRKSVKSLQCILNEWAVNLDYFISASAYSQARRKFCHTAFIELLEECIIKPTYEVGNYSTYKGHRLLAIDGSTLKLPNTGETRKEFGLVKYVNGHTRRRCDLVEGKMTIFYDVLNKIPLSASLTRGRTNDIKASIPQIEILKVGDIVIADRGFVSYEFFHAIVSKGANFIIRIKCNDFKKYHNLFEDLNQKEVVVEIDKPAYLAEKILISSTLKIRFVKVLLPNGVIEVLATSLIDKKRFPAAHFKVLYRMRWGIETYFHILKSRLSIDNFTGKSKETILQDFYSTIFISGLETVITENANEALSAKKNLHQQKVNKAISFHAIKFKVINMIFDPPDDIEQQLLKLFTLNPTLARNRIREKRRERIALSNRNSLYYQRYARKHVY